eukprot:gene7718-9492_t
MELEISASNNKENRLLKTSQSLDIIHLPKLDLSNIQFIQSKPSNSNTPRNILLAPQRFRSNTAPSKFNTISKNSTPLSRSRNGTLTNKKFIDLSFNSLTSSQNSNHSDIILSPTSSHKRSNTVQYKTHTLSRSRGDSIRSKNPDALIPQSDPIKSPRSSGGGAHKRSNTVPYKASISDPSFFYPDSPLGSPKVRSKSNNLAIPHEFNRPSDFEDSSLRSSNVSEISLPYNFSHIKHVDEHTTEDIEEYIQSGVEEIKEGWLGKKDFNSKSFKTFWVEIKDGNINLLSSSNKKSIKDSMKIFNSYLTILPDSPNNICIQSENKKKHWVLSGNDNEMDRWVNKILNEGSIYGPLMDLEIKKKEMKNEERIERIKKMEEDYIKEEKEKRAGSGNRISLTMAQSVPDSELLKFDWNISVINQNLEGADIKPVDKKSKHTISVNIDKYNWKINRTNSQIKSFFSKIKSKVNIETLKKEDLSNEIKVNEIFEKLVNEKSNLMSNKKIRNIFVKFISPLAWEDEKPKDFTLPFKIDLK